MPRTKKQKTKIAKRFAIASVIIIALTFVVREMLKEKLKDIHDSAAKAEAQFRTESGQTVISLELLVSQEQAELQRLQDQKAAGKKIEDYTTLIAQATTQAQQALSDINVDFDSASRLIDALPSPDLRKLREQVRTPIDKMNMEVTQTLKPSPDHDLVRFVKVKVAMILTLLQAIPVAILGDQALTVAHRVQEATERGIRFCSWFIGFLAFLGFGLGLYAAITGIHTDAVE